MNDTVRQFVLQFITASGRVARVTIPRARTGKTSAEVQASMQALINSNAMMLSASLPTGIKSAQLVETDARIIAV
jgi:hypothetical protein